jgi:hypothetical protein
MSQAGKCETIARATAGVQGHAEITWETHTLPGGGYKQAHEYPDRECLTEPIAMLDLLLDYCIGSRSRLSWYPAGQGMV